MAHVNLRSLRVVLWTVAIIANIGLAAAFLWVVRTDPPTGTISSSAEADIRSMFSLIDHTGRDVTESDYSDQWQLVFFGFTYCPDICPTTLDYVGTTLDLLGPAAGHVAPLFISVDPERDTAEIMAEYVAAFHPLIIGLTGSPEQIAAVAEEFKVYYARLEDEAAPDGYLMAHSGYLFLMRPDGSFEAVFRESGQEPERFAKEILVRIGEEGNSS
ncbi:MAG: SCO family protein [Boseongicola sp.]